MTRRVTLTPHHINVTREEFLAGIERARERRAAFAEMSRPRRKEARQEPQAKPGRAWRRLDDDARREVVAAAQAHLDNGMGTVEATRRVASKYGMGESTVRKLYYEARYAAQLREAAP